MTKELDTLILDYVSAQPLELPLKNPENTDIMTITKLNVSCKNCGGKTQNLRGSTKAYKACLDVKAAGVFTFFYRKMGQL